MTQHNDMALRTTIIISSAEEASDLLRHITGFQTVSKEDCDRCYNLKKYSRGRLPIKDLCIDCQEVSYHE